MEGVDIGVIEKNAGKNRSGVLMSGEKEKGIAGNGGAFRECSYRHFSLREKE